MGVVAPPELSGRDGLLVGSLVVRRRGERRLVVDPRGTVGDHRNVPLGEPSLARDAHEAAASGLLGLGRALVAGAPGPSQAELRHRR